MSAPLEGTTIAAEIQVKAMFRRYVSLITEAERQDYFDPRNRDTWMEGFAEYLLERKRKALGASND